MTKVLTVVAGVVTEVDLDLGAPTRSTITFTSSSLAHRARQQSVVALGKSFRIVKVQTDRAARVRLYTSTSKRSADANRGIGVRPTGDAGVLLDMVTKASVLTLHLSPVVDGSNDDTSVTTDCPITVDNLSGATHTVAVTITYFTTET